jgi:hypothetical protein
LKRSTGRPKRNNEEATHQSNFFAWLALAHPKVRKLTYAIPNGGNRNFIEAVNLKRQGVTKGVPDVFISIPSINFHGFYIEFKVKGRKLTAEQFEFMNSAREEGYLAEICYDFEEAKELLENYLIGSKYLN